jgi:hypothetical protein
MARHKVPSVLKERLLIDNSDRQLLNAIDDLSPKNNSGIYVTPSIFNLQVPTLKQISDRVGKPKKEVWSQLNKIRKVWNVPEASNLPMNRGFFDKEDALVSALTNQHRLRWDEQREDYRVTKIHLMSAEMGLGQLYTNNKAFEGEKIARQSLGLDDMLNSVHLQGGIMPEMIQMFGKAKNQRALMTGLNKAGDKKNGEELGRIKQILNLGQHELTPGDMKNLQEYVIDTLGSLEEAAKSAAHELLPVVKNVPEHVPIHFYYSYNDQANMSEIEDTLIASQRKINAKMNHATKNLPKWREKREELVGEMGKTLIDKLVVERVYYHVNTQKSKYEDGEFPEQGQEFKGILYSFFETAKGEKTKKFINLKEKVKKKYEGIIGSEIKSGVMQETFDSEYFGIINRVYDEFTTFKKIDSFNSKQHDNFRKIGSKVSSLENKINEAEQFENASIAQDEGPAWFTGKIAITPMEAKVLQMTKKEDYKRLYTEILIPTLKEISGKDYDIKLHTDSIITVNVPDPQDLIEGVELKEDSPIGTLLTSFPRTNEQRSNEPIKNSAADLQKFHEGNVAERVKKGKSKPKTVGEFDKRDFSSSDIYLTSYGADGFMHQPRFTVGPTTIKGEFRLTPEITQYIKAPTRHDTSELGKLGVRGNKGTWPNKRIAKGGCTTGNTIYIEHADQSFEPIFIDDLFYERISEKYGEEYSKLENILGGAEDKLSTSKESDAKSKHKQIIKEAKERMEQIHEEVRPELYNVFLQNDLHLGGYTTPGRPSLVDGIKSSQLAALQSLGLDSMKYSIMTEAFDGEQAWKSFDAKRGGGQGSQKTPVSFMRDLNFIKFKMKEAGYSDGDILDYSQVYVKEFQESKASFLPEEQISLAREVIQPTNEELMDHGMISYVGAGNHWMASKRGNISEADVICNLFDKKYEEQGKLIRGKPVSGQSYSYETVRLPSSDGKGIEAVVTHKLASGKTEISQISSHLLGTRTQARYCFTADRHHPGVGAEKGKMFILDAGKPPTNPYVDMIGKVSSVRGTVIGEYGAKGEQIVGARYFVDPVVDTVSGWDHTAGILSTCKSFLEEAINDSSLLTEKRKIDYARKMNKGKFDSVSDKYGKKD